MSNFSDTPAEGEPFERATFVTRASSVPTTTDDLLDRPPLVAARSAEKLARNALAGIPQAREEVVRIAKVATERIYSHSVREEMLSDSSLVVLEMLAPVLKDLRRSGELSAPQAEFLAARVRESARDWLQASTAAKADAGIGRQPGADEATAHLILGPFQAAGLLRTLAALSSNGRIRPDAELGTALGQAAHVHPFAINPGLLVDVLDAHSVQSVDALRISLRAAAQMPQPSAPPAVVVAAAAADVAVQLLKGETPKAGTTLFNTPSQLFVPALVTSENLKAEIIDKQAGGKPIGTAAMLCGDRYAEGCKKLGIM